MEKYSSLKVVISYNEDLTSIIIEFDLTILT